MIISQKTNSFEDLEDSENPEGIEQTEHFKNMIIRKHGNFRNSNLQKVSIFSKYGCRCVASIRNTLMFE